MSSGVPPAGPKKRRKKADKPRLLHRNPGMALNDYTSEPNPLHLDPGLSDEEKDQYAVNDPGEAVSPEWQHHLSEQGETADKLRATMKLAGQQHRLHNLTEQAQEAGVDITRQQLAIERQLKVIATKTRRKAA